MKGAEMSMIALALRVSLLDDSRARRHRARCLATILGVQAVLGAAAPARAVQSILTFEGPTTTNAECFLGVFPGSGCIQHPTVDVTYKFLLDTARAGERITQDASGATTVETIARSQFARFLGQPVFEDIGPVESRITFEEHMFGLPGSEAEGTIVDVRDVSADLPDDVHFENLSHHEVISFSGQFELGGHYEGLQEEMLIDGTSIVREHRLVLISDLTLTEIETLPGPEPGPVPEPDSVLPFVGAVGVLMASSLRKCSRTAPVRPFSRTASRRV